MNRWYYAAGNPSDCTPYNGLISCALRAQPPEFPRWGVSGIHIGGADIPVCPQQKTSVRITE